MLRPMLGPCPLGHGHRQSGPVASTPRAQFGQGKRTAAHQGLGPLRQGLLPHQGSASTRHQALSQPLTPARRRQRVQCQAASSALLETTPPLAPSYEDLLAQTTRNTDRPLPKAPTSAELHDVLPYLFKLALQEKTLYWRIGVALMCLVLSKTAGLMCPLMLKQAVDAFAVHAGAPLATILSAVTGYIVMYGVCDVVKHLAKELQAPVFTPVAQAASRRVAYHTFAHVLGLDIRFHLDRRTGRLSRILERGTRSIQMVYRAVIFTFAPTALELIVVCAVLANKFSPLVGGMVLITFAAYISWSVIMTQAATDARKRVNELDNATSAKAVDALLSYETVTLFNNHALEIAQYNHYLKAYMQACLKTDRLSAILNAGQAIILAGGLTSIMILAVWHSGPNVTAGSLVMIQGLLLQLWAPLQFLGWFYRELRSALVDMEEFFSILRTQSNLKDGTHTLPPVPTYTLPTAATTNEASSSAGTHSPAFANAASISNGVQNGSSHSNGTHGSHSDDLAVSAVATQGSQSAAYVNGNGNGYSSGAEAVQRAERVASGAQAGSSGSGGGDRNAGILVELNDVVFGYNPERLILKGLSLRVEPGKSLALVGPSGSGKSTVLRLLTRLYDVESGSVKLNGMDVRDITLQSLREAVALVPQETMLFNDTIMQNIRYGRPDASDEDVIDAAQLAHLHEAIMKMPKQYATVVGERGLKLSGGEKQRLAIARAFLRQPKLLICDEATSALDSATESQIMNSLAELAVGRTSVFVAHRLSTIKDCDSIGVMKDGRLVEQGSHDELMSKEGGLYRSMWELQAKQKQRQDTRRHAKQDTTGVTLQGTDDSLLAGPRSHVVPATSSRDDLTESDLDESLILSETEDGVDRVAVLAAESPRHVRVK